MTDKEKQKDFLDVFDETIRGKKPEEKKKVEGDDDETEEEQPDPLAFI